jgi:hypothetical protein
LRYLAELLILLGAVACGGNAVGTAPAPPDPRGPSAGTGGTSEMPSGGGTTSQPDPDPDPPPTCSGPEQICVPDCASSERATPSCDHRQYRCPNGWVDFDSCPTNACARRVKSCCSPTGHVEVPNCTEGGTIGDCPDGFERAPKCVPQGLGITDCSELIDGQACASAELVCLKDVCGLNCYCNPDASGRLLWQCWVNAC